MQTNRRTDTLSLTSLMTGALSGGWHVGRHSNRMIRLSFPHGPRHKALQFGGPLVSESSHKERDELFETGI